MLTVPSARRTGGALPLTPDARQEPKPAYGVQRPSARRTRTSTLSGLAASPVTFQLGINSSKGATSTTRLSSRPAWTAGRASQEAGSPAPVWAAWISGAGTPKLVCWE